MADKEKWWDAPGPFNMAPETTNIAMSKPSTQEWFGGDRNYYLLMDTSWIIGDKKLLDNNCCRGTKSCAEYNDYCRGTKIRAEHNDYCRGTKIRSEHNRLENQSCRSTNNRAVHSRLETYYIINVYVRKVFTRPQISYCEVVSQGLTWNTSRTT